MLHTGDSGRKHPVQQRAIIMQAARCSSNVMRRMTAMLNRNSPANSQVTRMMAMPNRQTLLRYFVAVKLRNASAAR